MEREEKEESMIGCAEEEMEGEKVARDGNVTLTKTLVFFLFFCLVCVFFFGFLAMRLGFCGMERRFIP